MIQIYKNPYKESINSKFYIPKEFILILNSLKITYNNKIYIGKIGNKPKYILEYKEEEKNKYVDLIEYVHDIKNIFLWI